MSQLLPLTARGAQTSRRGRTLAGPIDLSLEGHGTVVVMGPNGAGKTSLLRLLHGTARLSSGALDWACGTQEARHHQAFVFQRPVMLRRSVLDNIAYPLIVRGSTKRAARAKAEDWARRVGLGDMLHRQATVLSGGEGQKLALARALIIDPQVLFLDEPCASLDGRAMREIETILQDAKARGTKLILSTHDFGQARRLADQVLFMLKGRLHENSPAEAFFTHPTTPQAQAFLKGDIVE
ncbi:ATP-binding cassette domain-containing protein [Primorskyibacter sp. S187A]|uniref:ATP-binding cassette domain-containing protein n=1 Tax=Primorskyibacter sp. S187A TaxID=3415130 RepID=UPI003C7E405D